MDKSEDKKHNPVLSQTRTLKNRARTESNALCKGGNEIQEERPNEN